MDGKYRKIVFTVQTVKIKKSLIGFSESIAENAEKCRFNSLTPRKKWSNKGVEFHTINLIDGWEKALAYLSEVTK